MRTIWKYQAPTPDAGGITHSMPKGARVIRVELQGDDRFGTAMPQMWAEVDTDAELTSRTFVVVGTGHALPERGVYVGSYTIDIFEWHVYDTAVTNEPG